MAILFDQRNTFVLLVVVNLLTNLSQCRLRIGFVSVEGGLLIFVLFKP